MPMFIFPYDWVARILSSGRLGMSTIYSIIYLSVRGETGETKTLFPMVWHVIYFIWSFSKLARTRLKWWSVRCPGKAQLQRRTTTKKYCTRKLNLAQRTHKLRAVDVIFVWWKCCQSSKFDCFSCSPEFVRYFIPLVIAQPCSSYGFRVCWHQKKNVMVWACRQSLKLLCGSEVHSLSLIKFRVVFGIWRKFVWFWVSRRFFSHESLKSYSCWANQKRFLSLCSAFRSIFLWRLFFFKLQGTIIAHNSFKPHKSKSKASSFHS